MQGLFGTGWSAGKAMSRLTRAYVERGGLWSGSGPAAAPDADGLLAGTLVATEAGWQRAEDLHPGDRVVTFDNGMQPLRGIARERIRAPQMAVPGRALGNRREMALLPGQMILIESDAAEARYGDPFTLVPSAALEGHRGITRTARGDEGEMVWLEFDSDEIVYAEGTVLAHCPRRRPEIVATVDELIHSGRANPYRLLPPAQGRALIAAMGA